QAWVDPDPIDQPPRKLLPPKIRDRDDSAFAEDEFSSSTLHLLEPRERAAVGHHEGRYANHGPKARDRPERANPPGTISAGDHVPQNDDQYQEHDKTVPTDGAQTEAPGCFRDDRVVVGGANSVLHSTGDHGRSPARSFRRGPLTRRPRRQSAR